MHAAENTYHEGSFKIFAFVGSETESDPLEYRLRRRLPQNLQLPK